MVRRLGNSKAEDDFAVMLQDKYGLVEGEDFVREHPFQREFSDKYLSKPFKTRVDFWFPKWRIVVEFKCAPLATGSKNADNSRRAEHIQKQKGCSLRDRLKASWSNQFEKFRLITEQANDNLETSDILWILVDDGQMGGQERYKYYGKTQVERLRRKTVWNPMRRTEAGRLLYMFKAVDELGFEDAFGESAFSESSESEFSGFKKAVLADLSSLDTSEGLHLTQKVGRTLVRDSEGKFFIIEDYESRQIIKPPMR